MSDESEYDPEPEEFDIYKRKYQLLLERCEILQQVKFLPFHITVAYSTECLLSTILRLYVF